MQRCAVSRPDRRSGSGRGSAASSACGTRAAAQRRSRLLSPPGEPGLGGRGGLCSRRRCPALGPGGGKGPQDNNKDDQQGPMRRLAQQAERRAHQLLDSLTPKAEYDFADVFLIVFSTFVFMWVAAGMYRVYAWWYYASGAAAAGTFMGH
ncbi:hypothetical protein HYH02_001296 [Chlamydomonas schloesseri]|uniref:Uncharacterized protein n=1 Tax=Chlamydomonas schloesseri TaxID=2026947 RepID=A0A835WVN4_9CHLO|nr:hypothetical protein HYH02_001296 [Chlamydomonas schloesseri]|eukprot:KAG2454264.1 hypothetical protein HYH02_001296 [Chlamydomonas schloesseri]